MRRETIDLKKAITKLCDKYLDDDIRKRIEELLQKHGDEPDIIKNVLHELNVSGQPISKEDADVIRQIALAYL